MASAREDDSSAAGLLFDVASHSAACHGSLADPVLRGREFASVLPAVRRLYRELSSRRNRWRTVSAAPDDASATRRSGQTAGRSQRLALFQLPGLYLALSGQRRPRPDHGGHSSPRRRALFCAPRLESFAKSAARFSVPRADGHHSAAGGHRRRRFVLAPDRARAVCQHASPFHVESALWDDCWHGTDRCPHRAGPRLEGLHRRIALGSQLWPPRSLRSLGHSPDRHTPAILRMSAVSPEPMGARRCPCTVSSR